MKFENVYWDASLLAEDHETASIIAIGDSWFWYPFPGGSLLNQLGPIVATREHTILAVGNNGAEAYDYVRGKYRDSVKRMLNFHGDGTSAVFISGGGNDFAGYNDLRPMLNRDCSNATTEDECFKPGDADGTLGGLMARMREDFTLLIGQIMVKCRTGTKIFLHTYDYAVPTGQGVWGARNAWLKEALDSARVPPALQFACIRYVMDKFATMLGRLQLMGNGQVFVVDCRGILDDADWANELHPTPAGFRKLAREGWAAVLKAHGLST